MSRRPRRESREQKLMQVWWVCAILAVVFLVIAYSFVSLAIDSGNLLEWGIGFFFLGWAATQLTRSARYLRLR